MWPNEIGKFWSEVSTGILSTAGIKVNSLALSAAFAGV